MTKIILGTTSPYRKEVFSYLGIPFEIEGSNVDESQVERKNPEELVTQLSKLKAEAVARNHQEDIIIGIDSVGYFEGRILEKPKSKEEAFERLRTISGENIQFFTGVHMINQADGKIISKVVKTELWMRDILEKEINQYLDEDINFNRYALGFDPVKHISSSFIQKVEGSHYNFLAGIPLETVVEMLKEINYKQE